MTGSSVESIFASIEDMLAERERPKPVERTRWDLPVSDLLRPAAEPRSAAAELRSTIEPRPAAEPRPTAAVVRLPVPAPQPQWSVSLDIIRDVAARIREIQQSARDATQEAQQAVQDAAVEIRAAKERERQILTEAQNATLRFKKAAELIQALRAKLAETEERATMAEKVLMESQHFLRDLHESLKAR